MGGATTICPNCKKSFEISDAIQHQIEDELLRAKTEQSETLRKEYDAAAEIKLKQAVEKAISEAQQASQLQIERIDKKSLFRGTGTRPPACACPHADRLEPV